MTNCLTDDEVDIEVEREIKDDIKIEVESWIKVDANVVLPSTIDTPTQPKHSRQSTNNDKANTEPQKSASNGPEKPFKCEHCTSDFNAKIKLQNHIVRVHRNLPHKCKKCFHGFKIPEESIKHENECRRKIDKCETCDKIFFSHKEFESHRCRKSNNV